MSLPSFEETNNPGYDELFQRKEAKMTLFKRLGELFTPKSKDIIEDSKTEAKKALSLQVDGFLSNNMMNLVQDLVLNGYELNKKQNQIMHDLMINEIRKDANRFLNKLIKMDYVIDDSLLVEYCFSNAFHQYVFHKPTMSAVDMDKNTVNHEKTIVLEEIQKGHRKGATITPNHISSNKAIFDSVVRDRNDEINENTDEQELAFSLNDAEEDGLPWGRLNAFNEENKIELENSGTQPIHQLIEKKLSDPAFRARLFKIWRENIAYLVKRDSAQPPTSGKLFKSTVKNPYETFKRYSPTLLFEDVNLQDYMGLIELLKKVPVKQKDKAASNYCADAYERDGLIDSLQKGISSNLTKQIKSLKEHTQSVFSDEFLEKQTKAQSIKLVQEVNIKELPVGAKELIERLKEQLPYVEVNTLSTEQQIHFDNLTTKRLPEILQKYFSIHRDYRNSLKDSDGKTPETLMIESLQNIIQIVDSIVLEQQEEKVKDLSVAKTMTSHYTKRF